MDCEVCTAANGDTWLRMVAGHRRHLVENSQIGGYSQDSEHDLSVMVRDFLESGGSSGTSDSRNNSDGEAGLSDLSHLADTISFYKHSGDDHEYENELASVINSLILSADLHLSSPCKAASCLRFYLAKLLRLSGYDAAVCVSKWQGNGKNVPGGDHEYIDIIKHDDDDDDDERLIVEIDFQSHFEIARAVESYNRILKSLPVVYVGSISNLKQLLVLMVEAARSSLNQNSMPLPPWRSIGYLLAKWQSPHRRYLGRPDQGPSGSLQHHEHCRGHLKRLRSLILSEIDLQRLLKPMNANTHPRLKSSLKRPI